MYSSIDISERVKIAAKEKGVSVKKMLEDIGLSYNTMSNMKSSMPKADNLAKIADYLGCSIDYLMGRDEESPAPSNESRTDELLRLFKNVPDKKKNEAMNYLRYLANNITEG